MMMGSASAHGPAVRPRHVVVVGAGIVGLCIASYLARAGVAVTVLDRCGPGEATPDCNAGGFSVMGTPMALPGIAREVPGWLLHPRGPFRIRPRHLPTVLPWLIRFMRQATEAKAQAGSQALRALNRNSVYDLMPLVEAAAAALGHDVPLESQRGYHVQVPAPNVTLANMIGVGFRKVALTPMDYGLRIAGTVEFAGTEALPDPARAAALIPILKELVPAIDIRDHTEWTGHRPCFPDSLPVIGGSPRFSNAFFAFGHGHQGLMGAAPTGRMVTELMFGRDPGVDMAPYAITQF